MTDELSGPPTSGRILPLHCHTVNSVLDGASTVEEYLDYCVEEDLPACSCTDHGYVMGHYDLLTLSKKKGIKPIPGCEVYLHPGEDYQGAENVGRLRYFHLTLWARNMDGLKALWTLSNESWREGRVVKQFRDLKPRVTWEDLETFSTDGLMCGTGCFAGPINMPLYRADRALVKGDEKGHGAELAMAENNAMRLLEIFEGRLFSEVMPIPVTRQYEKEIVTVKTASGETLAFHPSDKVETELGEMTAMEACDERVHEIHASSPVRRQEVEITEVDPGSRIIEVIEEG